MDQFSYEMEQCRGLCFSRGTKMLTEQTYLPLSQLFISRCCELQGYRTAGWSPRFAVGEFQTPTNCRVPAVSQLLIKYSTLISQRRRPLFWLSLQRLQFTGSWSQGRVAWQKGNSSQPGRKSRQLKGGGNTGIYIYISIKLVAIILFQPPESWNNKKVPSYLFICKNSQSYKRKQTLGMMACLPLILVLGRPRQEGHCEIEASRELHNKTKKTRKQTKQRKNT